MLIKQACLMKHVIIFLSFLFSSLGGHSQSVHDDVLIVDEITINNKIPFLEASETALFQAFGQPDSTQLVNDEILYGIIPQHIYGKSYFLIYEGKTVSCHLRDARFFITYDGVSFRVGDHISKIKTRFPSVYKRWQNSVVDQRYATGFFLTLPGTPSKITDDRMIILTNDEGYIINIHYWMPS